MQDGLNTNQTRGTWSHYKARVNESHFNEYLKRDENKTVKQKLKEKENEGQNTENGRRTHVEKTK